MGIHLAELFGLFEAVRTAIRRILALEIEVPTPLTGSVSVTFDLSSFAFIAVAHVSDELYIGWWS